MNAEAIQRLIRELFHITAELEAAAPGLHFTPDGNLVGSIGEAVAAARYELTLTTASTKGVVAHDADGNSVEIKATTGNKEVALRGFRPIAQRLIVLQISATGEASEVYDGPAAAAWSAAGTIQSNGQRKVGLRKLRDLGPRSEREFR